MAAVQRPRPLDLRVGTRRIDAALPRLRSTSLSRPLMRGGIDHIRAPLVGRANSHPTHSEAWVDHVTSPFWWATAGRHGRRFPNSLLQLGANRRMARISILITKYGRRSHRPFCGGILLLWKSSRADAPHASPTPPQLSLMRSPPNLALAIRAKSIAVLLSLVGARLRSLRWLRARTWMPYARPLKFAE